MSIIQGEITNKEEKFGNTGGKDWIRMTYIVDNVPYSTFDTKLFNFNIGDNIEIDFEASGRFNNIKDIKKATIKKTEEQNEPKKKVKKYLISVEELN